MAVTLAGDRDGTQVNKQYMREELKLELELQAMLNQWGVDTRDVVLKYSNSSGIKDDQELLKVLQAMTAAYLTTYTALMDNGMQSIAAARAAAAVNESVPLLRSVNADTAIRAFKADMQTFEANVVKTWKHVPYGAYELTFLDRMEALDLSAKKTINNIVRLGVKDGLGSREIAALLESYVNPTENIKPGKPYDIARKLLGEDVKYLPKDVLPGSMQSNLYSIARTGSAEMYRNMSDWAYEDAEWIEGHDWVLSNSHPKEDTCDDLAAASPYPKGSERPFSHNYCLCDWVPHMKTPRELRAMLDRGDKLYNKT